MAEKVWDICMLVTNPIQGDPRVKKEAHALMEAGYSVLVIGFSRDGQFARGEVEGIPCEWVPSPLRPTGGAESGAGTATATGRAGWKSRTIRAAKPVLMLGLVGMYNWALYRRARQIRARVFQGNDLDTLWAAVQAASISGAKVVYDSHELFAEMTGRSGLEKRVFGWAERRLIRRADAVLTVSDSIARELSRRYAVPRPQVVRNLPAIAPEAVLDPVRGSTNRREIVYQGLFLAGRGLEELLTAAVLLPADVQLVLRGYGSHEGTLRQLADQLGLGERVRFEPPVPQTEMIAYARSATIGLLPYKPESLNNTLALPNKLFEYMAAGLAVAASNLPEIERLVTGLDIGVVFDPSNPADIAAKLNELLNDEAQLGRQRQNAVSALRTSCSWGMEQLRFLEVYQALL